MLKDYKNKTTGPIKGTFVISKIDYKTFANKPGTFLTCEFTDLSGSIKGIMWEGFSFYKPWLKNKTVVEVLGEISSYKDATQIQIKSMSPVQIYNTTLLVPSLPDTKIAEIETGLKTFKNSITNEICKIIWEETLGDHLGSLKPAFLHCPGGIGEVHHSYCGGLAEHSYSMIKIGEVVAQYQGLDRDILLTGCLIHDIGKIQCYDWNLVIEMTDVGRLMHHTFLGYKTLLGFAEYRKIPLDDPTFMKLAHIVIAHHEEEGIRKTMFAEACAVSCIDSLDALVTHAVAFSKNPENKVEDSNWTKFCNLTQKQYYIPTVQEPIEPVPPQQESKNIIDDLFGDL